jgi:hypothetical protein
MSARELQRVAVRMLYDEPFLERVYGDVHTATADCDLTADERSWLTIPDRRAWKVDPLRRSRSLAALVEEFAVSVALLVRTSREATALLDSFFSSDAFHRGMQEGASLAQIFGSWLVDQTVYRDIVLLEAALARVRRVYESGSAAPDLAGEVVPESTVVLAAGVEVHEFAAGTVQAFEAALVALRVRSVAEAALDRNFDLPLPQPLDGRAGTLVDGRRPDPRLESLSVELARVLNVAAGPIPVTEFVEQAAEHGADADDCLGLLNSFAEDGTIQVIGDQA